MKYFDRIAFRDDPFVSWDFYVSEEFYQAALSQDAKQINKMYAFYADYIEISKKYSLGEILPDSYVQAQNIDLTALYIDLCRKYSENTNSISFFPLLNLYQKITDWEFSCLHPNACKYTLVTDEGIVVEDYFHINRKRIKPLANYNFKKLPYKQENFEIDGKRVSYTSLPLMGKTCLGFLINTFSEFWFQRPFYGKALFPRDGFDNSFLAYHNTPRLNSYLRDLKDIWLNKYHWEIEYESWHNTTEDGILLDGEIVYQEDVDEGRVALPDLADFLS